MAPRALFLTPVVPARGGNGLAMRAGLFLEGLARRHRVDVVVAPVFGVAVAESLDGVDLVGKLAESCRWLEPAGANDARALAPALLGSRAARERLQRLPPLPGVARRPSPQAITELRELLTGADLVHVQRLYLAPWIDAAFDAPARPPLTLDLDELEAEAERQLGRDEQAAAHVRLAHYYLPRFDAIYVAAAADAERLRDRCGLAGVVAVPNAVRAAPGARASAPPHELLFVGTLSYGPNIDGAIWLCREVLPRLPAGTTVAVVGRSPAPEVWELARLEGVTVVADVPDVSPWYAAARVVVAPLRAGGGTRIKILEAHAHGRPVVATELAARGLPLGPEQGLFLADGAADFATACEQLLREPGRFTPRASAESSPIPSAEAVIGQIDRLSRAARARA
jgi:glycosyltransferase involved in cell wall biosynthesis